MVVAGVYKIDVLQGSRPVRGSPYHCQVFDATKVKIEALAANSVSVNENISFKCNFNSTIKFVNNVKLCDLFLILRVLSV